ncbi:hypothetical protein PG991_011881 [Apiospora marii]|uniref:Protein kinase domain-containing protein n=1 Tax=Apiospora marii TaxID=335849 RepID=A0ABR1RFR4_9PEZI
MDGPPETKAINHAKTFFGGFPDEIKFEGLEATGWRTVTMRLKVWRTPRIFNRYMIKMAFNEAPSYEYSLAHDIETLQTLQNAVHVVNLEAVSDSQSPDPEPTSFKPLLNPFQGAGLKYEHYLIEHMPNGSLARFIERVSANKAIDRFSNRFIISIFLCAARACAAMAWTPERKLDAFGYQVPEQAQNRDPLPLVHGANRPSHWLFGRIDGFWREHDRIPIMKLAGFDEAYKYNGIEPKFSDAPKFDREAEIVMNCYSPDFPRSGTSNPATRMNVLNVGTLMANIILEDDGLLSVDQAREQLGPKDQWSKNTDPGYDPELLSLIAMCIAVDPNNRPTIAELLDTLNEWIWTKDLPYYRNMNLPYYQRETNEYLQRLVQTYMFNGEEA